MARWMAVLLLGLGLTGPLCAADPKPEALRTEVTKFQPATPDEHKAAIEQSRAYAKNINSTFGGKFKELVTDHFLIYTDWDAREHSFLKENLEGAYSVVCRQFDMPARQNIFVGKLLVFMFEQREDFRRFAELDGMRNPNEVAGYYWQRGTRETHMAMWKPDVTAVHNDIELAKRRWAYTLTHEFTHAFIARYRTDGEVPLWLNEGIAEVIASEQFPQLAVRPYGRLNARQFAAQMAKENPNIWEQLSAQHPPSGEWYPVMRTLVETLVIKDRKAFIRYFADIKDGMSEEDALKKEYHWTPQVHEEAWRYYIQRFTP